MADETGLIAYSNTAAESSLVPFMVSRNIIRLIFSKLGRIQRCVMAFSRPEKNGAEVGELLETNIGPDTSLG